MLRATVLLLLVTSSTLARILTSYNEEKAEFPALDCAADYAKMSIDNQKLFKEGHPGNTIHSLCVRADGHFVSTVWSDNVATFTYMFNTCGWVEKKIEFPNNRIDNSGGCTFTKTKLFYSDTLGLKLHQYSLNGTYEGVFASGKQFLHQTVRGNLLYTTINIQKKVYAYDMTTKKLSTNLKLPMPLLVIWRLIHLVFCIFQLGAATWKFSMLRESNSQSNTTLKFVTEMEL